MRRAVSASAAPGAIKGFGRARSSRSLRVIVMAAKIPLESADKFTNLHRSRRHMADDSKQRRSGIGRRDVLRGAVAAAVSGVYGFPGLVLGQSNPKTVKIGMIQPMTGIFAYNGQQSMAGAKIAADEINARGGIKSLGGAKIELVIGDSQSKPEAAVAEVDKLSEQGIACFLGGYASGLALTATQASARNKVPFMVDGPVSDQITQRGLYGVFHFSPGFKRITDVALDNLVAINKAGGNA